MIIVIIVFVIALVFVMTFALNGAPYVPTQDDQVRQMLKLTKESHPKRVLDMGSGDGKLVMAFAAAGYQADGIEINPWLVWRSRRAIKRAGLVDRAHIYRGSFWSFNTSQYDFVTVYGALHIMGRLSTKFGDELPSGARIVSNYFEFPDRKIIKKLGRIKVYKV